MKLTHGRVTCCPVVLLVTFLLSLLFTPLVISVIEREKGGMRMGALLQSSVLLIVLLFDQGPRHPQGCL